MIIFFFLLTVISIDFFPTIHRLQVSKELILGGSCNQYIAFAMKLFYYYYFTFLQETIESAKG